MYNMMSTQTVGVQSSVADFYAGKSVFITGGTGFLGKVIIEKLLYSCPQINNLYVLIREKDNNNIQERMEQVLGTPIFDRVRTENPNQLTKIIPIAGDIGLPELGISPEDDKVLIDKVSVAIHSAATVKFNEPLKVALNINSGGTRRVLDLCRRMEKLEVLVHISTAYAHTLKETEVVEEKLYPCSMDMDKLYVELNKRPDIDENKLLCGRPNTYTFTKALAERVVEEYRGDIPTVIIRPSIVTASKSEPVEGWVDNWYGATSYLTCISRGFARALITEKNVVIDLVPVDYVSNLIVVAAAKCHNSKNIEVFNSCSSAVNPIKMGKLINLFTTETVNNGCNDLPFPKALMTEYKWLFWMVVFVTEIIPAYIADFCLIQFGNPARFIKTQAKSLAVRRPTEYFTTKSWIIQSGRARKLAASLSSRDAAIFPCDPSDISWSKYIQTYFSGVKRFLWDGKRKF